MALRFGLLLIALGLLLASTDVRGEPWDDEEDYSSTDDSYEDEEEDEDEEDLPCGIHEAALLEHIGDTEDGYNYPKGSVGECSVGCPLKNLHCTCNDPKIRNKFLTEREGTYNMQYLIDVDHGDLETVTKTINHIHRMLCANLKGVVKIAQTPVISTFHGSLIYGKQITVSHLGPGTDEDDIIHHRDILKHKTITGILKHKHIPVFFIDVAPSARAGGWASYPWMRDTYIFLEIHSSLRKSTEALTHEFGHLFGLYHTHHGIEADDHEEACSVCHEPSTCRTLKDGTIACEENDALAEQKGDLCADTLPDISPKYCDNRQQDKMDKCTEQPWGPGSQRNLMSYSVGCRIFFTECQMRRMRCFSKWSPKLKALASA